MTLRLLRAAATAALLAAASLAAAHDYTIGDLKIGHPMTVATSPRARTAAAYMTIENRGTAPDRLLAAATPAAGKAELHATVRDGDVMRMRALQRIEIGAGAKAVLQPGGVHIMMTGLVAPLKEGDRVPMTLTFEKAGTVEVELAVESARGAATGHDHAQ